MKYLCLIYVDQRKLEGLPAGALEAMWRECEDYDRLLRTRPGYLSAAALQPARSAITVRRRSGSIVTTDGPFAETKEHLGGFLLIDVPGLDDALAIAAKMPTARLGSVEVRPVMDLQAALDG